MVRFIDVATACVDEAAICVVAAIVVVSAAVVAMPVVAKAVVAKAVVAKGVVAKCCVVNATGVSVDANWAVGSAVVTPYGEKLVEISVITG